jgi:transcriptional regulator with XRE-family HTH domain
MRDRELARQFGRLIRGLRVKQGMSQEEFADHCSLHRTYIGSIERGEKTITIETAYKIAQALGIPLSQLFRRLEMEQSNNDDNRS